MLTMEAGNGQRAAEEIRFWKRQERDQAMLLRSMYFWGKEGETLAAWERAFAMLEAAAEQKLDEDQLMALAEEAVKQSQHWAAALEVIAERMGGNGPAPHMARESSYYQRRIAEEVQRIRKGSLRNSVLAEGTWSDPASAAPNAPVPIGGHTLPPLPYAYDALEPHLDAETVRIHHSILHKNYVEGLNRAEEKLAEARRTGNFDLVKHWERELAFNGAGHYLHTVYFFGMSPDGGGQPSGALAAQITEDFGSFEAFRRHFAQAAEKVEGSGWAHLIWSPRSQRLQILQAEKHQNLTQWDDIPLLSIDVWEHSYYLKYKNERAKYIEAWFELVNWPYAAERFHEASKLKWKPL